MTPTIHIGDVSLPLNDFVVARTGILGITRSGKTYAAKGIAEQLLDYDIPIVVFDAIGVWRFLKTAGPGHRGTGFKVVVAGGEHPDLPLTAQSAPQIVRAAIKENIPLVIDLYDPKLSKADWRRIVQESFRILLYENKGLRHIFLEEAAEYAPQKVMDGQTYAEVEKLARMGGNKGLGITFINQRAQELNKAVLELCDNLVLLRQRGSHAITALEKWLDKVSPDMAREIAAALPHMEAGDAWVWAEASEQPYRTHTREIRSLHPDRRLPQQAAAALKTVDTDEFVQKLSGELGKLIESQKANDPRELQRQVASLKRQLAATGNPVTARTEIKRVPHYTLKDGQLQRLEKLLAGAREFATTMERVVNEALLLNGHVVQPNAVPMRAVEPWTGPRLPLRTAKPTPIARQTSTTAVSGDLTGPERKILTALAMYPDEAMTKRRLALLAGYAHTGGAFNNPLSKLNARGLVARNGSTIQITSAGVAAIGEVAPLPTGADLAAYWIKNLPGPESTILSAALSLMWKERQPVDKATLAAACVNSRGEPYEPNGGAFNNPLGRLRTLGLLEGNSSAITVAAELFD